MYITKYYRKKIVFQIKKNDVKKIYIKKGHWTYFFGFLYESICGPFTKPYGTCMSIVFERWERIQKEKNEIPRISLRSESEKELFEICEILSINKCLRFCKKIPITPIFVQCTGKKTKHI